MLEPFDQLEPAPAPKPPMPLGKVVLINFGIMLAYMAFFALVQDSSIPEAGLGALIGDAFLLVAQVGLNLLVGIILTFNPNRKHIGSAMIIGGFITAAIGFGTCLAFNGALL